MVYDTKTSTLYINNTKIKLTKKQHLLMIALSSRTAIDYGSLTQYTKSINIHILKRKLCKKTGDMLKIKTITGYGLLLESEVSYK